VIRLALLVCGHTVPNLVPRRGDFVQWFRAGLGLGESETPAFDLEAGERPPSLEQLDGLLLTGSPAMVTDRAPWSLAAEELVREAHGRGLPLLGVCYGHQLIAQALGGEVGFHPRGRELGTVPLALAPAAADDVLFAGLPADLAVQSSHSQSVLRLPPGAVVLARNDHDPHQAFRLGTTTFGVQFHPEFDADIVRGYIEARADQLRAEGCDPASLLVAARDDFRPRTLLQRFVALVAARRPVGRP
jgi:GMP synthase (glutamine-hydrolysing)